MELFEIHITGNDKEILREFREMKIKTLEIQLLDKRMNVVGLELMCSHQKKFINYEECVDYVQTILLKLKSEIVRVKIETPYQEKYVSQSVYCEVHFPLDRIVTHPTVRNINSGRFVSTHREYSKEKFLEVKRKYEKVEGAEFELCLHDSNPNFDDFWLSHYKQN